MIEALAPVADTWGKLSPTQKIIAAGVGGAAVVFIGVYRRGSGGASSLSIPVGGASYGGTGGGPAAGAPAAAPGPSSPGGATGGNPPPADGNGSGNSGLPAGGPAGAPPPVGIVTQPGQVMPANVASGGARSILSWWQSKVPQLIGGGSPAQMFGTVQGDAGPTASLSGAEYALTQIPGLTQQQLTAAVAGLSGGAAAGPGGAFGVGSLDTLYARANNIVNALNEAPLAPAIARQTGLPAADVTTGASSPAVAAALGVDLKSIQDATLAQTAQAWGSGTMTDAQARAVVATWAPSDRAAYNQLHGTSY